MECSLRDTCGRRLGKNFLTLCGIGLVPSRVRPVDAARVAAGPRPRNDHVCIVVMPSPTRKVFPRYDLSQCQLRLRLLEVLTVHHHGPSHPRDLIGERDGRDFDQPALHQ
jgi:hypothetical protein